MGYACQFQGRDTQSFLDIYAVPLPPPPIIRVVDNG